MCICIGVLIPIYCDVLFLHGYDSSTTSAIMDTVMAIAALYAAYSVRHWLKDRVKNKGFEQAEKLLTDINTLYVMNYNLKKLINSVGDDYMKGSELDEITKHHLKQILLEIIKESKLAEEKRNQITIAIYSLKMWDMRCNYVQEFKGYLQKSESLYLFAEAFSSNATIDNKIVLQKYWKDKHHTLVDRWNELNTSYKNLNTRFIDVFSYIPKK